MPTYEHRCTDAECNHEWEDEYSMMEDPPKFCPKCNKETTMRLISGGGGCKVELTGHELTQKINEDTVKLKKDLRKSENLYANFIGEEKYQNTKVYNEDVKRETNYFKQQFRRIK